MNGKSKPVEIDDRRYPTLSQFEAGQIDAAAFDHRAHVNVAWQYLEHYSLHEAVRRYCDALQRLTQALGVAEKYNETVTWFFLILIAEKRNGMPGATWDEFCQANPELCNDGGKVLRRFYSSERLNSSLARRVFLVPDRPAAA